MIPKLFTGDTTSFTGAGLGWLPECTLCEVTEERNGIFECEFRYPVNGPMFKRIKPGCIVYVPHDVSGDKQPFDIYAFSVDITGMATFRARHISYRVDAIMMFPGYEISGYCYNGTNGVFIFFNNMDPYIPCLNKLRYGMPRFTASGFNPVYNENPYVKIVLKKMRSMRDVLMGGEESIVGQTNGEIKWDGLNCTLYKKRGAETTAVIRAGRDLAGFTYEYDESDKRDAYIPYWTDPNGDFLSNEYVMDMLPSSATSYPADAIGAPCVYDHVYVRGDYFTAAPLDVTSVFEKNVTDGNPGGLPTADDVYDYASNEYNSKHIGQAYENLTIDFQPIWQSPEYNQNTAPAEKLKLCDTAQLFVPELGVNKRMKVCKTVWNVLEERYTRLEFGSTQRSIYTVNSDSGTAEESQEGTVIIVDEDIPIGEVDYGEEPGGQDVPLN